MSSDGHTTTAVGSSHMVASNTSMSMGSATLSSRSRSSCVDQQHKH